MQLSPVALDWIKKGKEEGFNEGVNKGEMLGEIRLLERLLSLPVTSKETLTNLSLDQLQSRVVELETQWQAKSNGSNP
jgi:flagellar biosynthesis/type III secretory pathway protein FliH